MNWGWEDFAFASVLIAGLALAVWLTLRGSKNLTYRAAFGVLVLGVFLLIWSNAAVGIIGDEREDRNIIFAGILLIAIVGGFLSKLAPRGMSLTLIVMAAAQMLIGVMALALGWGAGAPNWPYDISGATALFCLMWISSAWLFRRASAA